MTTKQRTERLTRDQKKHLLDRINNVWRAKIEGRRALPESAEVKKARAVLARHGAATKKAQAAYWARMQKAIDKTKEALLFASPSEALALVKKLEATDFNKPAKR